MRWDFTAELARYGPQSPPAAAGGLSFARSYCAHVARTHYENFTVASVLLPRRLVPHFHAVYAYCRWADDLADETTSAQLELLDWWRNQLLACYAGEAWHPVFVALRDTITHFRIPPQPFLDLLLAFAQDQRVKRYELFADLLDYCRHSANPVGHLVLYLFECFTPERAALADEVCTGLQLANFWQDIARDFAKGRVYLPAEDCRRFGYSDSMMQRFTPAFAELLRFQVERTRGYFERGATLLPLLPYEARTDVELFIAGGCAVLDAIERAGFNVWAQRPKVTKRQKLMLLLRAAWRRGADYFCPGLLPIRKTSR